MTEQETDLRQALDQLLARYRENFQVREAAWIGGREIPALARYRHVEEKTVFGFRLKPGMLRNSEAGEAVAFLLADALTPTLAQELIELVEQMEEELLELSAEHDFTIFSVVLLTRRVDKEAAHRIKRFRLNRNYSHGWGMGRIAVLDLAAGTSCCSVDGKSLAQMASQYLAGK